MTKALQTQKRILRHRTLQKRLERVLVNMYDLKAGMYRDYVPDLREMLQLHTLINLSEFKR